MGWLRTSSPPQNAHTECSVSRDLEWRPILKWKNKYFDLPLAVDSTCGKGLLCSPPGYAGQISKLAFLNGKQTTGFTQQNDQIRITRFSTLELFQCLFSLVPWKYHPHQKAYNRISVDHETRDEWPKFFKSSLNITVEGESKFILFEHCLRSESSHMGCDLSLPCSSKLRHIFSSLTASQRPSIITSSPQKTLLPVLTSELELTLPGSKRGVA